MPLPARQVLVECGGAVVAGRVSFVFTTAEPRYVSGATMTSVRCRPGDRDVAIAWDEHAHERVAWFQDVKTRCRGRDHVNDYVARRRDVSPRRTRRGQGR